MNLYHELVKQSTLPKAKRSVAIEGSGVLADLPAIKPFDVTAVSEAAEALWVRTDGRVDPVFLFLPAPVTLIWSTLAKGTVGVLMKEDGPRIRVTLLLYPQAQRRWFAKFLGWIDPAAGGDDYQAIYQWNVREPIGEMAMQLVPCHLAMINSPRVIGRHVHMPHAGLQRKLAAARGLNGKFPLQATTEIILEVKTTEDDGAQEVRLTGEKALHFVRSHLRIVRGKLVIVKAHWRGNPALGMKNSRYTVVPPRDGSPPRIWTPPGEPEPPL